MSEVVNPKKVGGASFKKRADSYSRHNREETTSRLGVLEYFDEYSPLYAHF